MDGIIEVRVNGHTIIKDSNCAGAQYEENSTKFRISFAENWSGYAKTVTFWDALGENPVKRVLTSDFLEDISASTDVYIIPIPGEAMTEAGKMTFVIDGYVDGVRKRTVKDTLNVLESDRDDEAGEPSDPTPTQAEQLQTQFESVMVHVQKSYQIVGEAAGYAHEAELEVEKAKGYADEAFNHADTARYYKNQAQEAVGKTSYIGEDGYWYEWDADSNDFVKTEVLAEGKTGVHVGSEAPTDPDVCVWVEDDGSGSVTEAELLSLIEKVNFLYAKSLVKTVSISLPSSNWMEESANRYYQVVTIAGTTEFSKVDLQPTAEQLVIFHEKDIAFVTENEDGVVTVYCIGQKPVSDYTIQATITEVETDE